MDTPTNCMGYRFAQVHAKRARSPQARGTDFQLVCEPGHCLALLERNPGAFDAARPLENWPLPACCCPLRRRLGVDMGPAGVKEYIEVLRLFETRARYHVSEQWSCSTVDHFVRASSPRESHQGHP